MIANTDGGGPRRAQAKSARRPHFSLARPPVEGVDDALEATRRFLLESQRPDGYWVGELEGDTILESEYILLMAFLGRHGEETCARLCKYIHEHQLPSGGWSILSRRADRPQRVGEGLLRAQALRDVGRAPVDGPRPPPDPRSRRRPGLQQLHAVLSRPPRPDLARRLPHGPARDPPAAEADPVRPLRHVVLDQDDGRHALGHLGVQARQETRRRTRDRRAFSRRLADASRPLVAAEGLLGQLLRRRRQGDEVGRAGCARVVEEARPPGRASLDARSLREYRRPRRHLPADGLLGRGPPLPRLREELGAGALGARKARRTPHRRRRHRHGPRPALPLADLGHRDHHHRPGRRRPGRLPPEPARLGPLAPEQGIATAGRLARPIAGRRADRLVLPVPE